MASCTMDSVLTVGGNLPPISNFFILFEEGPQVLGGVELCEELCRQNV
jgi:hypothetical protein